MKVQGTHPFATPRDILWPMLLDPNVLSKVMPGCEKLEQVAENQYEGVIKIQVGPVQGKFNGVITLTEINAPEGYTMNVNGRGPAGFVNGTGKLKLIADNQTTTLEYEGDAEVGGKIASVGQRLLDTSARAVIRQSLQGLENHVITLTTPQESPETTTTAEPPRSQTIAAPSQAEFALGVARNFFEELIPEEQRPDLLSKILIGLSLFYVLRAFNEWRLRRLARRVARILAKNQRK